MAEEEATQLTSFRGLATAAGAFHKTVTYSSKGGGGMGSDVTLHHIQEAKEFFDDFECLYKKHRMEMDQLKKQHSQEVRTLKCTADLSLL